MATGIILGIISVIIFIGSILGYVHASKLGKQNTSQLKKDQKASLQKKVSNTKLISHCLLAVAFILGLVILVVQNSDDYDVAILKSDVEIEVTSDKDYGAAHTEASVIYEMAIPTSGTHSPHDLKFGFYTEKPPNEELVHNLEHGDIIIHYRSDADASILDSLKYLTNFRKAGAGVLAVPSEEIPDGQEVVVTAWLKTMELPAYDEQKTGAFIYEYINEGPEQIPPSIRRGGGTM